MGSTPTLSANIMRYKMTPDTALMLLYVFGLNNLAIAIAGLATIQYTRFNNFLKILFSVSIVITAFLAMYLATIS